MMKSFYAAGDCGQAGSGGESPQTAHPSLCYEREELFAALKGGKRLYAAGDCGQAGSAWRKGIVKGNKLFPLKNVVIRENCNLKEKRSAVRHLKKQNGMKYRNLVWLDCKLWYRTGRTAVTGRQRSESAGRFGQVFQKWIFV